jgi:ABC-type enterobactin transport system permease subunit
MRPPAGAISLILLTCYLKKHLNFISTKDNLSCNFIIHTNRYEIFFIHLIVTISMTAFATTPGAFTGK